MATSRSSRALPHETVRQGKVLSSSRQNNISPPLPLPFWRASSPWALLFLFRCVNALSVRTFFQPDEYFQSLEPAWQIAFGQDSGAWITWEWHHQLRSSVHPALFAVIYYVADKLAELVWLTPHSRGLILAVIPNIVQAAFAATGDYYTWKLADNIYGMGSDSSWVALIMTVLSPWQWFCSTRTFSNCLETTLTVTALYFWPWSLSSSTAIAQGGIFSTENAFTPRKPARHLASPDSLKDLRISLLLAAIACILRPTNGLIWFCILMPTAANIFSSKTRLATSDYVFLALEASLCGAAVLILSAISDRLYFEEWTFPPYQFLNFNISQDLAVFYGRNDWHYYVSQGLPLLLTTYLPFALVGLWKSTSLQGNNTAQLLANTVLVTVAVLSIISHKEVRFIYPLLPLLHIIAAPVLASCFLHVQVDEPQKTRKIESSTTNVAAIKRKPLIAFLFALNLIVAGYTTLVHQRGVLDVLTFLRSDYESLALDASRGTRVFSSKDPFVGFLMPCHSTPWRSKLVHSDLSAWALGCEPPIHLAPRTTEREAYRDEADRFYDEPLKFLRTEINTLEKPWPRYIVGFAGIEGILREHCAKELSLHINERWRGKNSDWHDDSRRVGDVIVWEFTEKV